MKPKKNYLEVFNTKIDKVSFENQLLHAGFYTGFCIGVLCTILAYVLLTTSIE